MFQDLQDPRVFQVIKVLQVLRDPMVHPSPAHQDPGALQEPKDHQGGWVLRVHLDRTVKLRSQGLEENLGVLGQMESQDVLVRLGNQVRTLRCLEMTERTGTQAARGQRAKRDLRGPQDSQGSLGIQETKVFGGLQV